MNQTATAAPAVESQAPAQAPAPAPVATPDPLAEHRETINALRRVAYAPDAIGANLADIQKVTGAAAALELPIVQNYDPEGEMPSDMSLALIPIPKNRGKGESRQVIGLAMALIPTFEATQAVEGGERWIRDLVESAHISKVANAFRATVADGKSTSVPKTAADFIANLRAAESLVAFDKLHEPILKALSGTKERPGLAGLTKTKLRTCLSVAAFAETNYPNVTQEQWEGVIHAMLAEAQRQHMDPGAMASWLTTRAAAQADTGTFDLDGLSDVFGGSDDGSDDASDDSGEEAPE